MTNYILTALVVLLYGCASKPVYKPITQAEAEREARAVNAIHKQLREGR